MNISYKNKSFFQIVAVILSNTGIALLAYMDGVAQTRTLGGVVLAAAAAAGSATYKVISLKSFKYYL
jgi:solute carrier family 35 protein F3/4